MRIIELTVDNHFGYKAFLEEGLKTLPNRFRITAIDDSNLVFPTDGTLDSFTLGAIKDQRLLGVASFAREGLDREKLRHKGLIFRMYVRPEASGQGIGSQLLTELISRVRNIGDIEQINLTVVADNEPAKHLYAKYGFEVFSTERNALKYENQYFDEETRVLFL